MEISKEVLNELYKLSQEAGKSNNLATAAVLIEKSTNNIILSSQSRVGSDKNPLAHADMLILNEAFSKLQKMDLQEYIIISVFEPSLMSISACYWAGIKEYYYFLPAAQYIKQIPWASEGNLEKAKICAKFSEPVKLEILPDPNKMFKDLCDKYLPKIISKAN